MFLSSITLRHRTSPRHQTLRSLSMNLRPLCAYSVILPDDTVLHCCSGIGRYLHACFHLCCSSYILTSPRRSLSIKSWFEFKWSAHVIVNIDLTPIRSQYWPSKFHQQNQSGIGEEWIVPDPWIHFGRQNSSKTNKSSALKVRARQAQLITCACNRRGKMWNPGNYEPAAEPIHVI